MKQTLLVWSILAIVSNVLFADSYDPYELSIMRDGREEYCYLTAGEAPIFYFSCPISGAYIGSQLEEARRLKKKISIAITALPNVKIKRNAGHSLYFLEPVKFFCAGCFSCKGSKPQLTVSDSDIEFDWVDEIYRENISLGLARHLTLNIFGKKEWYWITSEQKRQLVLLLNQGHKVFKINLTALILGKPHRDLIPADQVIVPISKINN